MNRYFRTEQRAFVHAGEIFLPAAGEFRFAELRHGTWADVGAIATIAAAAASLASIGYSASGAGTPKLPNGASSSRQVAQAQADVLPMQRQIAAAEQEGGNTSFWEPTHKENQQFIKYQIGTNSIYDRLIKGDSTGAIDTGIDIASGGNAGLFGFGDKAQYAMIPYKEEDWQPGGKFYNADNPDFAQQHLVSRPRSVKGHEQSYDFEGYGTADVEGKLAKQMADMEVELGKKYGPQFAEEATREARLADPQGFAARDKELELIQREMNNPTPINPLATSLDARMKSRVDAGSGLDDMSRDLLDAAVARANADRSGSTSAGAIERNMSTGTEGAARREANTAAGQSWLSSGSTPEDIAYRREEQNLANEGAFINGRTPESQFQNLSGVSQGAAPMVGGQPLPTDPGNASTAGPAYSVAAWQANLRNQASQANGWLGGISGALSAVGGLAKAAGGQ